ncbi:hypothetical protein [Actinorugispora endophytica]|uniref:DUF3558 domain-containing protein n=1 Tax=Actinorugispora endophytica TaxID=1605990 RepID=A0A4R6UM95_9ACTN|nr:hypothetical protein [Actinorugispora endophytica]TDQ48200.1 hypothetical protein EV190_11914 [Actinorugispora endophytica]
MIEAGRRRGPLVWLAAAGGFAAVTAAAITGGLLWGERGPAASAAPDDAHATAPACAELPAGAVEAAVPSGVLETDTTGPLPGAASGSCAWSSVDVPGAEPRVLTVDFRVHYSDGGGEESGEARAREELGDLARVSEADAAVPLPSLGEDALVRQGAVEPGAAEALFRDGNLVVRVWYGGPADDQARDGAIAVARELAAALR